MVDDGTINLSNNASWTQNGIETGNPVLIFNSGTLTDESGTGSFDLVDTPILSGTIPKGQTVTAEAVPSHNAEIKISGTVTNEGTLALNSPSKGGVPDLVGSSAQVQNKGVLSTQSASTNAAFLETNLTNAAAGTVEVKSGELRQDENTTTTNEGAFKIAASATFAATTSKDLFVNKGSLSNAGTSSLTNNASWTQEAATATQSGNPVSIFNSGTLTDVSGAGSFDLIDSAVLSGTIPKGQAVTADAIPSHNAEVKITGTVTNEGTLALDSPAGGGLPSIEKSSLSSQVNNDGLLTAQSESSQSGRLEVALSNEASGTVEVKSGELRQDENTTTTNKGSFDVLGAATFAATTSSDLFVNKGSLSNAGTELAHEQRLLDPGSSHRYTVGQPGLHLQQRHAHGCQRRRKLRARRYPGPQRDDPHRPDRDGRRHSLPQRRGQNLGHRHQRRHARAGIACQGGEADFVGASSLVKNEGVLTAGSASGNPTFLEANLTNAAAGTVEIKSGELRQDDNTTTTNEGTFVIAAGASLGASTSSDLFVNKGKLEPDVASTSFGTIKLSNGATFEPGGSILPELVEGYAPPVGTEFDVITSTAAISGTFTKVENNFEGDYSKTGIIAVRRERDGTATSLIAQPNPSTSGEAVTLTATITTEPGAIGNPEGTVEFFDGGKAIGQGTVSTTGGVTTAALTTSTLAVGTHKIVATYNGDSDFGASSSTPTDATVNSVAPVVESITPHEGPKAGGTSVTIKGSGFVAPATVTIGSEATSVEVISSEEIKAKTVATAAGPQEVIVKDKNGTSTLGPTFTYVPAPTVTQVKPSSGPAAGATSVTITGTDLTGATKVSFGATAAASFQEEGPTEITATSPAGTGTVHITVTTAGGTSATGAADEYSYIPAPTVESITPSKGPQAGGTPVTIKGQGFKPTSTVTIGAAASEVHFVSATELTAKTPAGSGVQEVVVTDEGSSSTGGPKYTYVAAPTVTSVEPNEGSMSAGTPVTINGANLTGATKISFGATAASGFTEEGPTKITATSPGGTGTVHVTITTAGGTSAASSADEYTYDPKPQIGSLSVSEGPPGGGTLVEIIGSGFTRSSRVSFGSTPATEVTYFSAKKLTAVAPPGAGIADVIVTSPGGASESSPSDRFTYAAPASSTSSSSGGGSGAGASPAQEPSPKSGVLGSESALAPAPVLAVSGDVAPVSGTVLVRLPGTSVFVPLSSVRQIPFGTVIDATNGSVRVTTASPHGGTQTGEFFSGEFILTQGRNGLVVAKLAGGNFSVCSAPVRPAGLRLARAASGHSSGKHAVRKLWANAHGSFSTQGNYAAGAVQGTEWLTEDLCEGTLIKVTRDRVRVTNLVTHRHVEVLTGHSYLAKAPGTKH